MGKRKMAHRVGFPFVTSSLVRLGTHHIPAAIVLFVIVGGCYADNPPSP